MPNVTDVTKSMGSYAFEFTTLENTIYKALTEVNIDFETGEILDNDDSEAMQILDSLQNRAEVVVEMICHELRHSQSYIDFLKAEEGRIYRKRKQIENRISQYETYILDTLDKMNAQTIEGKTSKLRVRLSQFVDVKIDAEELPEEYKTVKTTISPNKTALSKALKSGTVVEGVALETRKSLTIG